jgi:hypothetical protein
MGNQTVDNYTMNLYNFITNNNVTKCPIETPFLRKSDSKCINCTEGKPVFDLFAGDCVSCPTGTKFNPATHKCEKAETPAPTSKCTSNYVWNEAQQKCVCPDAFPIDLGCECVTCLEPFVWNVAERACKLRCEETHVWNNNTQACECPKTAPYEVNGQCIACDLPFEWQPAANTCQLKVSSCGTPSVTPVTPVTPVAPVQTCTSNFVWDSYVNKCVCPPNLPFNDGTKCLSCNLPQYWDHDLKQCLYCSQGKYFNTLTRNCEPCPAAKPVYINFSCEACPGETSYDPVSNTCQDSFIDPAAAAKVPVYTTTTDSFIDPAATSKVPVYSTR